MLIVGFFGGLASQVNQYAFYLQLKREFAHSDIRILRGDRWLHEHNGYELERVFGIQLPEIDFREVQPLANFHFGSGLAAKFFNLGHRCRQLLCGYKKSQLTLANPYIWEDRLLNVNPDDDWLYWSNYPASVYTKNEEQLRTDLQFVDIPDDVVQWADIMEHSKSVSIHLRRGDYQKFGFELLGDDYYQRAVAEIQQRYGNLEYFVFSDDLKIARNMFKDLSGVRFVDCCRGNRSCYDLYLMAQCKHNIIANSGFSLLGAWMNANSDKLVITPRRFGIFKHEIVV